MIRKRTTLIVLSILLAIVIIAVGVVVVKNNDNKKECEVTFLSNDGTVLKVDVVTKGQSANPPVKPQMSYGTVFKSWDVDISRITSNVKVNSVCEDISKKENVFAIEGAYGKSDGTVIVPIRLCGDVCTSAFDLTINYDSDVLELTSVKEDGGVIYNDETPGKINLNYVSVDNTTADVDICYLEFSIKSEIEQSVISLKMNKIYEYDKKAQDDDVKMIVPKYTIVNGTVFVLPKGE